MSCPDCQKTSSRKTLWLVLIALLAVAAIGVAQLAGAPGKSRSKSDGAARPAAASLVR